MNLEKQNKTKLRKQHQKWIKQRKQEYKALRDIINFAMTKRGRSRASHIYEQWRLDILNFNFNDGEIDSESSLDEYDLKPNPRSPKRSGLLNVRMADGTESEETTTHDEVSDVSKSYSKSLHAPQENAQNQDWPTYSLWSPDQIHDEQEVDIQQASRAFLTLLSKKKIRNETQNATETPNEDKMDNKSSPDSPAYSPQSPCNSMIPFYLIPLD